MDLVTEAAILEVRRRYGAPGQTLTKQRPIPSIQPEKGDGKQTLWKGHPLLSISEHYVITNERVRIVRGLFGKDREDIELIRIQDIDHSQTLRERALNVGDISIKSHDRSHPSVVLNNVRDVQEVHEILRRAVLSARKQYNITFQEEM